MASSINRLNITVLPLIASKKPRWCMLSPEPLFSKESQRIWNHYFRLDPKVLWIMLESISPMAHGNFFPLEVVIFVPAPKTRAIIPIHLEPRFS